MAEPKQDKSWMLNARAIKAAKSCIEQVENELDIKLKLSHPDFLELLLQFTELTDSEELQLSLEELAKYAPADFQQKFQARINDKLSEEEPESAPQESAPAPNVNNKSDETVLYRGKSYSRYQDGKEFKGLYRGQPHYL